MADVYPPCWLLLGPELFGASGQTLFTHDGDAVVMPALDLGLQEGAYDCIRIAANGGVSEDKGTDGAALHHDFVGNLNDAWTAPGIGTWSGGIDENDRVWLANDAEDWKISPGASNAEYGYDAAGEGFIGGGGPWARTASGLWTRGIFSAQMELVGQVSGKAVTVPTYGVPYQDLVTMFRPSGIGDVADTASALNIQKLHNDAVDVKHRSIRWVQELDGRLSLSWPTSAGSFGTITWGAAGTYSDTFRQLIGAHGDEPVVVSGGVEKITFTHPPAWTLAVAMPIDVELFTEQDSDLSKAVGAGLVATHVDFRNGYVVRADVEGPASVGALHLTGRTAEDLTYHLNYRWLPLARAGARLTIVRGLDWRRHRDAMAASASDPAYSLVYTAEVERGALRTQIETAAKRAHTYDSDAAFYSRLELSTIERRD